MSELEVEMTRHGRPPEEDGPGFVVYEAWKKYIKPQSRELASLAHGLTHRDLWVLDKDTGWATRVAPRSWKRMTDQITRLYTRLGSVFDFFGSKAASPDRDLRAWDQRYREPWVDGPTEAGHHLQHLREEIAHMESHGEHVPHGLREEAEHYEHLVSEEHAARREAHRRWEEDRTAAHKDIRAQYAEKRVYAEAHLRLLSDQLAEIRQITADLQRIAEDRLSARADRLPRTGARVQERARDLLEQMASSRRRAQSSWEKGTTHYGKWVRKWMTQRKYLLSAINRAERRGSGGGGQSEGGTYPGGPPSGRRSR